MIDTGSSDLWCNSADSQLCSLEGNYCSSSGTYNANSSSTYSFVSSDFNITYADGSGAVGDYVTDTLKIGDSTLEDFQFGVGYSSTSTGMSAMHRSNLHTPVTSLTLRYRGCPGHRIHRQ